MNYVSLCDKTIKTEYRSLIDNVIQDFYIPLLSEAVEYKRAVGFFSSTSLAELSKGIAKMAQAGGKIQIVASPYLSDDDINAIRLGYQTRESVIEAALIRSMPDEEADYYTMERLNLLANLIADGILDIRIAYTQSNNGLGMYHEKMGIIIDKEGNRVAFSGSMNESATAMSINYETIDVFCSWSGTNDAERVKAKENAFYSIWNDCEPNIKVLAFPNVTLAFIDKYRRSSPNFKIDAQQFVQQKRKTEPLGALLQEKAVGARVPDDIAYYEYQKEAISSWVGENYRGIFDMATGTGKTLTGLGAVAKLSQDLDDQLAVFIVCPYQHLVEQWVEDIVRFNIKPIIGYSASPQKDWKKRLDRAVRDQKIRANRSFFCFVCTNATFTNEEVQRQISKIRSPILLVVDEAHNFGARSYSKLLDERFTYRLALSATLDRHGDEEGTAILYRFFGKKCIEYPLERAIEEGKLTPYRYYPVLVYLNDEELGDYEKLTFEMSKCLIKGRNGKLKLSQYGEILALKRSRIVAGAAQKLDVLREYISDYTEKRNILVYCGATRVYADSSDKTAADAGELRQIEAVTRILGNEYGMRVAQFTSQENMEQRAMIKEQFLRENGLQAIVAIKCLDEGVNIPGICTAFILASTTNPKEYIQRRGRVLRKAPNKEFSEIYDFVTLPRPLDSVSGLTKEQAKRDLTLVQNELARIEEFGRLALNPVDAMNLVWEIQDTYQITGESPDIDEQEEF